MLLHHSYCRANAQLLVFVIICCIWRIGEGSLHARRPASSPTKQCDRPCFNGGSCHDGVCVCAPGWTGPQCDSCFNRIRKNGTKEGYISDGPLNYSASSRCTWIIENDEPKPLRLRLSDYFTECCWDHLYVYDGDSVGDNLIAAFSGNLTGTDLMAKTGTAIVYFTSDLAFNLRGFNLTYEYGKCPYECNNNGTCSDGVCKCNPGRSGAACENMFCTSAMNGDKGPCERSGTCLNGACDCPGYSHGDLCQAFKTDPVWDRVPVEDNNAKLFHPRASHRAVEVDGKVYIHGGYMLNTGKAAELVEYDVKSKSFVEVKTKVESDKMWPRYDHSLVHHDGSLYVFGGVINQSFITNELWRLDLRSLIWSKESAQNWSVVALPAAVAGHTAHVIKDEMYVVFGYNPFEGYLHRVQIYSFEKKQWISPEARGGTDPNIMGRFGHSSVLASQEGKKPFIFVYGGFNAPLNSYSYAITDDLLMYDPSLDEWTALSGSGFPRFRHSAVLIDDIMLIFGGNSHNESTSQQVGCYSSALLAYDTVCRNWMRIQPQELNGLFRYGHAAVVAKPAANSEVMLVFGGFNGVALNDVLKLTPAAECDSQHYTIKECAENANGIRCAIVGKPCQRVAPDLTYRQGFAEFIKNDSPKGQTACYYGEKAPDTSALEEKECADVRDCQDCISRKRCGWCESTRSCMTTGSSCLDDLTLDRRSCASTSLTKVAAIKERSCGLASNCFACRRMPNCVWLTIETKRLCVSKADQSLIIDQHSRHHSDRLFFNELSPSRQNPLLASAKLAQSAPPTGSHLNSYLNVEALYPAFENYDGGLLNATIERCPEPCAIYDDCFRCVRSQCMWCPTNRRCVPMDTYMISFPYGQCQTWITSANTPHSCQMDPLDCRVQKTVAECQLVGPRCGWCDDGSGTGMGKCVDATINGPLNPEDCLAAKRETWFYTGEPECQCNGHSKCTAESQTLQLPAAAPTTTAISTQLSSGFPTRKCAQCANQTRGDHCEICEHGFFGDARNGGQCEACKCYDKATDCDPESGYCFCTTKGAAGRHCDHCEVKYVGEPKAGKPCTFELLTDFIFTFKLDAEDFKDKHVTQINFFSRPFKKDTDVQFSITCDGESGAKVAINLTSNVFDAHSGPFTRLLPEMSCNSAGVKRSYSAVDLEFTSALNTTFYVKVTQFQTPIKIVISFSQSPPINWVLFFVIFAACFIVLLVVAGILLLVKQRIRHAGNEANVLIENERMASRPKAIIQIDLPKVRQNTQPTAISVEPCRDYTTAIYTVVVRQPTGGKRYTPYGTSGLAVASSLCHLAHTQIALLEPPNPDDKSPQQKTTFRRFIPFIR